MKYLFPIGLVVFCLGLSGFFVYVTSFRSLTPLEGTFLQVLILLIGLGGTFWIGRLLPANRLHAQSAFRRVRSLYLGLSEAARTVDESRDFDSIEQYREALAKLDGLVYGQLITADDALEDWKGFADSDVENSMLNLSPNLSDQE